MIPNLAASKCLSAGVYTGGRTPGGQSESLILAPWSKVEERCPHPHR